MLKSNRFQKISAYVRIESASKVNLNSFCWRHIGRQTDPANSSGKITVLRLVKARNGS
jgi:hypothetical protein